MVFKKLCVAAILAVASTPVLAAECSVDIAGNDQMQFDKKEITVSKSCKQFTVNLKHPGKLAKNVMGHNWVLTKTADMQGAVNDGMAAGLPSDYVKKDDARVIAHQGDRRRRIGFRDLRREQARGWPGLHLLLLLPRPLRHDEGHAQAGRLTRPRLAAPRPHGPRPEARGVLPSACPYNDRSHDPGHGPTRRSEHEQGKVAIVTAGGSGMGAAAARKLAADGFRVAILSSSGKGEALAGELGGLGVTGSNRSPEDLARLVETVMAKWGRIDAVVNSAGHGPKGPLLEISDADWQLGMEFYLLNVVRITRLVAPIMQAQRSGAIVNISTYATFEPEALFPTSGVFRAGLAASPRCSRTSTRRTTCA